VNNRQCKTAKKSFRDNKVPDLRFYVGKRSKTFFLCRRMEGKPHRIMLGQMT
jgi:hypothetical protein